jgi:hypothetical protein
MNKNYTLKELVDIYNFVRKEALRNDQSTVEARELALKYVLNTIGYEFFIDEERQTFDDWCNANSKLATTDQFAAWKAGREELRKEGCSDQCRDTKTEPEWWEPEWITWHGGDKSPIIGQQTKYEVECRSGLRSIWITNSLRWSHIGSVGDIIAYRILD